MAFGVKGTPARCTHWGKHPGKDIGVFQSVLNRPRACAYTCAAARRDLLVHACVTEDQLRRTASSLHRRLPPFAASLVSLASPTRVDLRSHANLEVHERPNQRTGNNASGEDIHVASPAANRIFGLKGSVVHQHAKGHSW